MREIYAWVVWWGVSGVEDASSRNKCEDVQGAPRMDQRMYFASSVGVLIVTRVTNAKSSIGEDAVDGVSKGTR